MPAGLRRSILSRANQSVMAVPCLTTAAAMWKLHFTGGFAPGVAPSTCTGDTRAVVEGTGGFWYRFYGGPKGRFQFGTQYSYLTRNVWGGAACIGDHGDGGSSAARRGRNGLHLVSLLLAVRPQMLPRQVGAGARRSPAARWRRLSRQSRRIMTSVDFMRAAAVCPGLSCILASRTRGDDRSDLLPTYRNHHFRHQSANAQ